MVNFFFEIFSESRGFLPLKNKFRYGLLEYSKHFNWFLCSVGDFEDDVLEIKRCLFSKAWEYIYVFVIFSN